MTLNITEIERDYLMDLLDNVYKDTMREENRTDTLDLRKILKQRILLIDGLREKVKDLGEPIEESRVNIGTA
jgi:hypothetical protein